jgi:hypothetical protein
MNKIDSVLLGPLRPSAAAARSAPTALPVVVFTASGDQGRSVADALASDGAFTVTAITKFPGSDAAHALKGKGVTVVEGDMSDVASYEGHLKGMGAAFVSMDCESDGGCRGLDGVSRRCHVVDLADSKG